MKPNPYKCCSYSIIFSWKRSEPARSIVGTVKAEDFAELYLNETKLINQTFKIKDGMSGLVVSLYNFQENCK